MFSTVRPSLGRRAKQPKTGEFRENILQVGLDTNDFRARVTRAVEFLSADTSPESARRTEFGVCRCSPVLDHAVCSFPRYSLVILRPIMTVILLGWLMVRLASSELSPRLIQLHAGGRSGCRKAPSGRRARSPRPRGLFVKSVVDPRFRPHSTTSKANVDTDAPAFRALLGRTQESDDGLDGSGGEPGRHPRLG